MYDVNRFDLYHQYRKAEARLVDKLPILFNEVVCIHKYLVYNNASNRAWGFYCVNRQT